MGIDRDGMVVFEYLFVTVVVGVEVHPRRNQKSDEHAALTADHPSKPDEEEGQSRHQGIGFKLFHLTIPFLFYGYAGLKMPLF